MNNPSSLFAQAARPLLAAGLLAVAWSAGAQVDPRAAQREAAAARANPGQLTTPASNDLRSNALARCERVPAADKQDCVDRIERGQSSGSVEGGGRLISKETIITVPATAAPAAMPSNPQKKQ